MKRIGKGKTQGQQEESLLEQLLQLRRMKTIPLLKGKTQGQQEESLQEKRP
jgi:hypothetical protein